MVEIADITPSAAEATDKLLVRRSGSVPYGLDLLSDITPEQLVALDAEIAAARGNRSALADRISTISNFASPNAGGIVVGGYYDNSFHGAVATAVPGPAGGAEMAPFYTSERMRIDQIGVFVSPLITGALGKCFIYGSGINNWPDNLLFEGSDDLLFSTTGYKSHSLDFTFDSGRLYWLGVHQSSNSTLRRVNTNSAVNLGLSGPAATTYYTVIRRVIEYGTPLPASWNFLPSDRVANVPPLSIRMRAAAL